MAINIVSDNSTDQARVDPTSHAIRVTQYDTSGAVVTPLQSGGTVVANIGTTNGLALDSTINSLLKPASTLAAVTSITNTVTIKADTLVNQVNALKIDGSATTQPISAASLPLPTGASTSALQTTGNTSLSSIDGKTPALGQALAAASVPVVLTASQLTTLTPLSTVASTQSGTWNVNNISGTVSLPTGAATSANQATEISVLNTIATNTGAQSVDTLQTGTITALNGTVTINAQGAYTISVLITGTWVATLIAEGLMADGVTWIQLPLITVASSLPYNSSFSITSNGSYLITGGGYTSIRIRSSLFTSGTVSVALNASLAQQTIFSAQLGSWSVSPFQKQTFAAATTALATATTATDIFTITGSATKTIKIKHISLDGTQTTAGNLNITLIKRSTANTAGTSTTLTNVPFDSNNAAATAVIRAYTANPTLGTTVGTLHSEKVYIPTTVTVGDELRFDYTALDNMQEITLRGTNEVLAINLNSTTVAGSSFNIDVTWTEE